MKNWWLEAQNDPEHYYLMHTLNEKGNVIFDKVIPQEELTPLDPRPFNVNNVLIAATLLEVVSWKHLFDFVNDWRLYSVTTVGDVTLLKIDPSS